MDTNLNKNNDTINQTEQPGGFWHGGWAYFIFLMGIIGIMVALSYAIQWLF